jgi:lysophospholipase-2
LHGLGDSAENWQKTFEPLYKINPHIKFIFPSASWKFISMSYGIPMKAWYNIRGNINDKMNLECDEKGLLESVQWIENIIQSEINSGIASEKIIVGGFSQGGSLALTLGLITKQKLNKILCLSGFLPCREKIFSWAEKGNESTFVFYHNEGDEVVPFLIGLKSYELLRNYCGLEKVSFDERSRDRGHFWSQRNIEEVLGKELEVL